MKIYNAENQILGRICTSIAKDLLKGEDVVVINAEKAVLSGNPRWKKEHYQEKIKRGDPHKGPFFPRYPDDIFRRTVRGMLPWHKAKGRKAFKKLKVFIGVPEEFKNKTTEKVKTADANKLKTTYITLADLSLSIGAKKKW
ncbi:MAG: 50S ribosomal protein L13 [Candidatus Aenigmatarchaeota archaeon]|nr:50S ribosomal protein L13 [Candidatus Aenigmarchaeota archaeon]